MISERFPRRSTQTSAQWASEKLVTNSAEYFAGIAVVKAA